MYGLSFRCSLAFVVELAQRSIVSDDLAINFTIEAAAPIRARVQLLLVNSRNTFQRWQEFLMNALLKTRRRFRDCRVLTRCHMPAIRKRKAATLPTGWSRLSEFGGRHHGRRIRRRRRHRGRASQDDRRGGRVRAGRGGVNAVAAAGRGEPAAGPRHRGRDEWPWRGAANSLMPSFASRAST